MKKQTLVIGGTGFLGQKISRLGMYEPISSATSAQDFERIMDNGCVEKVIICAPSSRRYLANDDPLNDIKTIIDVFDKVRLLKPERILFCSTIDAYETHLSTEPGKFDASLEYNFYGIHRNLLESYLRRKFRNVVVIRLGNLFGYNLKKNIIYDLINASQPFQTPNNMQQWISADWLAEMIVHSPELFIDGMTLVSEPIKVSEISEIICRNHREMIYTEATRSYDIRSNYTFKNKQFCYEPDSYTFQKSSTLNLIKRVYG